MHESLAMCLTIRQNELRLGRQQISSLKEGVFRIRLLTSLIDPLVTVERKEKNEMMEDRRDERKERSQTRDCHIHTILPPMSLLAAVQRQSVTFVCVSCRVRTYAAKAGRNGKPSAPTKLPPAETTYSTLQSCPAPPSACSRLGISSRWHIFVSTRYRLDRSQLFKGSTVSRCTSG